MKTSALPCLLAAICVLPLPALAGRSAAHVHGVASLQVAVDGGTLTLQFETPLANLLGFEHAPRSEKQKQAVGLMADRLRQAGAVFTPSPAARCSAISVELESPLLQPSPQSGDDAHADLDGSFVFRCQDPAALRDLEVGLFASFPRLQRIDVQVAGPRGQSAARLSPQQRRVSW
ncbi:DUF2796 domain-containing protein [Accumulibacter sp.]|uniref:DUF2796 domain-containing protein n=1 Tax=Accumulibacter sp. TaxID=2053492 RepID=UPI0035B0A193